MAPGRAQTAGLVLAAGAGTRFGGPKGLARDAGGVPWVQLAVATLQAAGCDPVFVAVGAAADEVTALVPAGATPVRVADWSEGLAASVRAGLRAAEGTDAEALIVVTVDTPDLPDAAVARIRAHSAPDALAQAEYGGRPGHPVLIGRDHWAPLAAALTGDRGAGSYLRAQGAVRVECGDLWSGEDIDRR